MRPNLIEVSHILETSMITNSRLGKHEGFQWIERICESIISGFWKTHMSWILFRAMTWQGWTRICLYSRLDVGNLQGLRRKVWKWVDSFEWMQNESYTSLTRVWNVIHIYESEITHLSTFELWNCILQFKILKLCL